uniref:Cnidarian restricted protein n=1 Tax=Clytia hemisphaerica TaxID=252671 RepID=A0A7M6DQT4_9CNID|eukprot:TCONS_00014256-protein
MRLILTLLGLLLFVYDIEGRFSPSVIRKKTHHKKKTNSWKNMAVPVANLTFIEPARTRQNRPTVAPTTTLSFKLGQNETFKTLENTLDNISPTVSLNGDFTLENNGNNTTNNTTSNMILEVINIAPYFRGRSKYSKKFAMIVTLYAALSLGCITMAACLIRGIQKRNQRHRQYVLLTKRDMDYPVGGGGI